MIANICYVCLSVNFVSFGENGNVTVHRFTISAAAAVVVIIGRA